uniref:Protein kinase domain-containing protein n=1 Tax=Psilocybe cubensis TaxID=181762 RepID=A0A8H8CKR3_PSICU
MYLPEIRVIQLDSPIESLVWTIRHLRRGEAFPKSHEEVSIKKITKEAYFRAVRIWEFMAPFFASRGYRLHTKDTKSDYMFPAPLPKHPETTYPFARLVHNKHDRFFWGSPTIWGARDQFGRDVVIKMISDLSCPSQELRALQRLNSKNLRSDPYNHSIPVLDFLTFDNLVFVVMPRWEDAFTAEFEIVIELMEITKAFLEMFVLLHKNKIVHLDFLCQNTSMNVILDDYELLKTKGLRRPGEVKYALIDFGNAVVYPEDTVIKNVVATRPLNYWLRSLPEIEGPYNPFKADIAFLGSQMEYKVRHIENIIPEIGPFFDNLKGMMDDTQFTALQALSRFLEIYESLTPEQLQTPLVTKAWKNGELIYKTPWP